MVAEELMEQAAARAGDRTVKDVRAGLGYTCVMLEDGACGLAYTFRDQMGGTCGVLDIAGTMIGRRAAEILTWAGDRNLLKAAVGLAAINAVLNDPRVDWDTGNVTDCLEAGPEDTFGMVGRFGPIIHKVSSLVRALYVFELDAPEGSGLYPSARIPELLPACDIVVITATSIINHTFDDVIAHCGGARQVLLVGPSTPLCPAVFQRYPVSLLAGSVVTDPEKMLQIVSQGGGTMAMKPAARQVLARI